MFGRLIGFWAAEIFSSNCSNCRSASSWFLICRPGSLPRPPTVMTKYPRAQNLWPRKFRILRSTFCAVGSSGLPARQSSTLPVGIGGGRPPLTTRWAEPRGSPLSRSLAHCGHRERTIFLLQRCRSQLVPKFFAFCAQSVTLLGPTFCAPRDKPACATDRRLPSNLEHGVAMTTSKEKADAEAVFHRSAGAAAAARRDRRITQCRARLRSFLQAFARRCPPAPPRRPAARPCRPNIRNFKGKTLVNAINPHTPGYEAIDPKDPNKYVGFDIDLGEQIGECLGFKLTYKAVTFAALLTTLASGQADIVISDIYATEERAKAADFITYSKVFDGVLVAKGNPKKITGINISMCGAAAAENTGFVEVPLVQALDPQCKAAGKPEPTLQLYDNNANCIQAILAGPRRHLCQRRQHRRPGGEGQSRQAGEGDRGDHPLFGRHRRSQGQARIPRRRAGGADRSSEGRHSQGAAEEVGSRRRTTSRSRDISLGQLMSLFVHYLSLPYLIEGIWFTVDGDRASVWPAG